MRRPDEHDPWELLGVRPGASREEIQAAYERLSSLLAPGSLAYYSAAEPEEQRALQRALHRAYLLLTRVADAEERAFARVPVPMEPAAPVPARDPGETPSEAPPRPSPPQLGPDDPVTGAALRQARESRGATIDEMAARTHVRSAFLHAIEEEEFASLPEKVFTRGFVMTYARELGIDGHRAWASLEPRFAAARA